ncbi:IS66 family insertion sequence element accessory protein TnpA [Sediminispirochaeta smaragdinae]|uniref:Transposase n=1 Tax=Sediminispirochaeta smaragdinae (strain DSM 11293 / JCM 15392 / SEBR 4228) TaxID=573413 RepID=E1RBT1_SEDSS|nr:hypothetical protein [Sediminispirochaeta smaragdinae]ADK79811.1 hypothetical protein Spirs_0671 [Sediminispirochaeta smaragdinae DSM 11293]
MPKTDKLKHWEKIFDDWNHSGLNRAEYCREKNLKLSTFDYWQGLIKKESTKKGESGTGPSLLKLEISSFCVILSIH